MLFTITMSLIILVAINLLLLKFSCNKTIKKPKLEKQATVLKPYFTKEQVAETLAPTGS